MRWDLWQSHKLRLFSPSSTFLFHEHSHSVSSVLHLWFLRVLWYQLLSPGCLQTLSFLSVLWGARANYSYFETCSRLRASAASACNGAIYRTFKVKVLIRALYYTYYIKRFANWACQCVSLGFEPGSLYPVTFSKIIWSFPYYFS